MSENEVKVVENKGKLEGIDIVEVAKNGLAIVGGVAIVGGTIFLIAKGVSAAKATEVVVEKAPEIAKGVAEAAEVVL